MKQILSILIIICMLAGLVPTAAFARTETAQGTDEISAAHLPDNYVSYFDRTDREKALYGDKQQEEIVKANMGYMTDANCLGGLDKPVSRDLENPYFWWFKLEKGLKYDEHDFNKMQTFLETTAENGRKNGLQLSSSYDKNEPATWAGTCWEQGKDEVYYLRAVMFNSTMLAGTWGWAVPSVSEFCLGGALDLSGMTCLESIWSEDNRFSYADFTDCKNLRIIWNRNDSYNNNVNLSGCVSLETLIMTNCGLTNIDLAGLTSLYQLEISYNDISDIDLSACKDIIEAIEVSHCKFESIDLRSFPKLRILNVDYNNLTSLDVSNNLELGSLDCSGNRVVFLDMSKHQKLSYFTANNCDLRSLSLPKSGNYERHFSFADNKLTEIDLKGVTGLRAFNCDNNYVKELDLSDCPFLVGFVAKNNLIEKITFGQNPCLESITVPNNRLTELVIPKEAAMFNRLFCENNYITELDLSGFSFLYEFDCHNNNIKRLILSEQSGIQPDDAPCAFHIFDCTGNPIEELINVPYAKTRHTDGRFDLYSDGGGYAAIRSELIPAANDSDRVYKLYVSAEEAEGCAFEGWYVGDSLVGTDREILITSIYGFYTKDVVSDFEYTELTAKFTGKKPQDYTGRYEAAADEHMPTQSHISENCTFNENDVKIMREFLEQTGESGKKNGEKLMAAYYPDKPESWTCCFWAEHDGMANLEALFLDNQLDNDTGEYVSEDRYTLTGTLNMAGAEDLKYVYLYGSEFSSVDFTGCTSLTHLYAGNNGKLSDVNLTGCDNLFAVDLSFCDIKSLDLTNKSRLNYLNVEHNSLDSLDLSLVPELSFLNCAYNAITELDTDKVPHLLSLHCENNKIKELDVHMCTDMGELNCAHNDMTTLITIQGDEKNGNYAHMHVLHCEDNALTSLYVVPTILVCHSDNNNLAAVNNSNSVKGGNLMYIYISHNKIKEITFDTEIYLVSVDCSYNELEKFNFVQKNQLMVLDCSHNKLTKSSLPTGLMENRVIYYDCSGNNISEIDLWRCGRNMYYINISDNPVVSIKNAPLGYILRQPITLGDPMFYRINIKVQGTGYIDYDLDTITAIGDDFTGFYTDGTKLTAEKTLSTDGMQSCNITAKFGSFATGDVNFDDTVNTGDAVVILKHSAEIIQLSDEQKTLADCNHDGKVNTGDAVLILKYAAGMITEF